jgi:hypothetical protein
MCKTWVCAGIVLAACTHHASPESQSVPEGHTVTGRITYADSATVDSLRRAHPPTPEMEAFSRRFDSLAALVDTIVVLSPDSIILRVGQSVDEFTVIRKQARRASGEVLPTYPGFMAVEDTLIAQTREAGLIGVAVGRTRMILTVMNRKAHAPPSYVVVRVVP